MSETISSILASARIIPVIAISNLKDAVPLANTFARNGIRILEIVLRTPAALDAIKLIAANTDCVVGAGSILTCSDALEAKSAGARFFVSPGHTVKLVQEFQAADLPLLPGVSTASEMMTLNEMGLTLFKFFPAASSGGIEALKALSGPLPHLSFCPTGGVTINNFRDYLALPNVRCVGGSWLASAQEIENNQWDDVSLNIRKTLNLLG